MNTETRKMAQTAMEQARDNALRTLIPALRRTVARRFAQQRAKYRKSRDIVVNGARFAAEYDALAMRAYMAGAEIVARQLSIARVDESGDDYEDDRPADPPKEKDHRKWGLLAFLALLRGPKRKGEQLAAMIDDTTLKAIRGLEGAGVELGKPAASAGRDISRMLKDWERAAEDSRSMTIALTELDNAISEGAHDAAAKAGALTAREVMKEWLIEDEACDICVENASDGRIPEDLPFASGHQQPTAHARCRCVCYYSWSDDGSPA